MDTPISHNIKELYAALSMQMPEGVDLSIMLTGITADSRQVQPGWIFVAEKGVNVDGHNFISKALDAGAAAIVCEYLPEGVAETDKAVWIKVKDSAQALGELASWWYGYPSRQLTLIGVTGTNGKTTIASLTYEMARLMGEKAGLISTVVNKIDTKEVPSTHTTPDPITLNRLMAEMVDEGCTVCAMEVSSHACAQKRIAGLEYDGGIFTNLTRDHLDYHGTFANYRDAKKSFFDGLGAKAFALTNVDDRNGEVMLQNTRARRATYSIRRDADFHGRIIEDRINGMLIAFDGTEVETRFTGAFNASNLTAVYGAGLLIGWERTEVLRAISQMHPVAGRMQTIYGPTGVTAVVDYAHTPDALTNVLTTLTEVKGAGRIITVVGAGGDRDKGKRPLMAAEAAKRSDAVIITSDNPRTERAEDIAADMMAGILPEQMEKVSQNLDRAAAIRQAIAMAEPGDIVLIAGKGHENYQIIGQTKHHFDDCEEVRKAFEIEDRG